MNYLSILDDPTYPSKQYLNFHKDGRVKSVISHFYRLDAKSQPSELTNVLDSTEESLCFPC